jgi:hypothetical protein
LPLRSARYVRFARSMYLHNRITDQTGSTGIAVFTS